MGAAVELPLKRGPGHYIITEAGDEYLCREAGVVKNAVGKLPAGMVCSKESGGLYRPWADGDLNAVILFEDIDATVTGAKRTFTVRLSEVQRANLSFAGSPTNTMKNTAFAQLAANHVVLR